MRQIFVLLLMAGGLLAQETTGEDAITKVFKVLSGAEKTIPGLDLRDSLLLNGAWESLAYIDAAASFQPSREDLQEAVPDYYNFLSGGGFIFKLINPQNHNEYGYEGQLKYRWEGEDLVVLSADGLQVKDRWQLLYLDHSYLALRMGDLRVFFTHTPNQE